MEKIKILAVVAAIVLAVALIYGCGKANPGSTTQKQWTIMLFCAGDNDLQTDIFNNIVELQASGSTGQVNMVAQADWWHHSGSGDTMVTGEGVGRWYIQNGSNSKLTSTLVQSLSEINTGTAEAIKDFVSWAAANYPASHYLLIVSSHGSGWRNKNLKNRGFGQDYTDMTQADIMSLPDLKRVLPDINTALGKKLDIFAIDCCLNGMVEVAYQIKDYADLLVASEDVIPSYGYNFTDFGKNIIANPTWSATDFSKDLVNTYYSKYYESRKSTLAAIDLSKIDALTTKLKGLTALFTTSEAYIALRDVINLKDGSNKYVVQRYNDVTFRDLWHLADNMITQMTEEAFASITVECAAIKTAVENAVILSKYTTGASDAWTVANSHGISIYVPTQLTTTYETNYIDVDFAKANAGNWGAFLNTLNDY